MTMYPEEIVKRLRLMAKRKDELIAIYKRKRSWRKSEIAMAIADAKNDKEALLKAATLVEGLD